MIYKFTTSLAELLLRLKASFGGSATLKERLVVGTAPKSADIWIHGASVGELTSARPIIEALASSHNILVTANSETGKAMVVSWGLTVRLAPLDTPGALGRFLDAVRPHLMLTVEGEFWPLRSRLLAERHIPQAVIGARMSERSAAKWQKLRGVIGPMLARIAALSAQDAGSEKRLRDLGLPDTSVLPRLDLKLLAPAKITPPEDSAARDKVILAASTHEGEDAAILDGWLAARETHPDLRLILAPRHPQRGDEIAALITARGLPLRRRSNGAEEGEVLLADTLGEMPRWYAAAGICFVGGSLADNGGHTPWEPAAYRCAILSGPHVSNHADNFAALSEEGAAITVTADTIAAEFARLAGDPVAARKMGQTARDVLDQRAGDPDTLISHLRQLAKPFTAPDI